MTTLQEEICKRIYTKHEMADHVLASLEDYQLEGLKTDLEHQYAQGQEYRENPEHVCRKIVQLSRIPGGQIDLWAFMAGFLGKKLNIRLLLADLRQ